MHFLLIQFDHIVHSYFIYSQYPVCPGWEWVAFCLWLFSLISFQWVFSFPWSSLACWLERNLSFISRVWIFLLSSIVKVFISGSAIEVQLNLKWMNCHEHHCNSFYRSCWDQRRLRSWFVGVPIWTWALCRGWHSMRATARQTPPSGNSDHCTHWLAANKLIILCIGLFSHIFMQNTFSLLEKHACI